MEYYADMENLRMTTLGKRVTVTALIGDIMSKISVERAIIAWESS